MSLRADFNYHMNHAAMTSTSRYCTGAIDVVVRKYPGERASTSVIGNAVSRAIYDRWKVTGVRWRVVAVFKGGERIR